MRVKRDTVTVMNAVHLGNIQSFFALAFSTLHGMPAWTSDEKGVCPSVKWCIVTKRKKDLSRFLYHTQDHLA